MTLIDVEKADDSIPIVQKKSSTQFGTTSNSDESNKKSYKDNATRD